LIDHKSLHTWALEKLFGPIQSQIIRQDQNVRIIHLRDENGQSRTLGVVKFMNTDSLSVQDAHGKILAGGLLGKTLLDSKIDFDKEIIGTRRVKLPDWLMRDFKTEQSFSLAIFSKISLDSISTSKEQMLYAQLIEVVSPDLEDLFTKKTKPLSNIDQDLLSLMQAADLVLK
jgi:hypothetical protein